MMYHAIQGKFLVWALGLATGLAAPAIGVSYPQPGKAYKGQISIRNSANRSSTELAEVRADARKACFRVHRALFASTHWWDRIWEKVGTHSINLGVLYRNRAFYEKRWRNRLQACESGRIKFRTAGNRGYCGTEQGTEAYVKVTFGFVHSTINLCDLFFQGQGEHRVETVAHEFGRLEDIGDSPNFDTNNIYVWDAITRWLSNDRNWELLEKI